ncbi:MAG TPA: M48 family metalloprotease [Humisphaera sp.]
MSRLMPTHVRRLPRRRRGRVQLSLPIIIAVGVALFGVFRYFTSTQTNPVTGEAQRVALSPQQEVALGLQSAPRMAQQFGGLVPDSDPRSRLVDAVGARLLTQLDREHPGHPWKFQFHLLADRRTINAFALPGGQVFITLALLEKLSTEAQLAGVLGHEMGHVIHRHSAQHLAKGQLGQSLVTAVGVGASGHDGGYAAAQVANFTNQMVQLKYGREDESESDTEGLKFMVRAGYDPAEMVGVMRVLQQASGGRSGPEFTSSHPDPGRRANDVQQWVDQMAREGRMPAGLSKGATLVNGYPNGAGGGGGKPKGPFW